MDKRLGNGKQLLGQVRTTRTDMHNISDEGGGVGLYHCRETSLWRREKERAQARRDKRKRTGGGGLEMSERAEALRLNHG